MLDLLNGFVVELRNAGLPVSLTENLFKVVGQYLFYHAFSLYLEIALPVVICLLESAVITLRI